MKWEIGAKLRVLDANAIDGGDKLNDGYIYEVVAVDSEGLPMLHTEGAFFFEFFSDEMQFVERVFTADDYAEIASRGELAEYELSDAELGEPSESPNVTLSEIYEELLDMKAMIGRLIRNEEESE